jgi:hypothetical protein
LKEFAMSPLRRLFPFGIACGLLLAAAVVEAAPPAGAGSGTRPSGRPGYGGGHYGHGGHYSHSSWGWGLGVALTVPWALGWVDPYGWGPAYYPSYAYRGIYPAYPYAYGNGCGLDDDCWRAQQSPSEPAAPTTQIPPLASGPEGGPTERPLHLNYCESARAWFPHVQTCAGGWRLIRPEYGPAR